MPIFSKIKRRLPDFLVLILAVAFLAFSYYIYHFFHYVSAPGGDLYNHAEMTLQLQKQGLSIFFSSYPKFFHLLVLGGMKLTGRDPLWVMLGYLPLIITGAGFLAYTLLKRLSGAWIGLLAFVLVVFASQQPLQTLYDGGFPSYINTMLWLPLVLLGLSYIERPERRKKGIVLTLLGAVLMIITHHFSALYLGILLLTGAFFLPKKWRRYALFVLVLGLVILVSPMGSGIQSLLSQVIHFGQGFPWIHFVGHLDNQNAILPLRAYADYFTPLIWWGGVLTMLGVISAWIRKVHVPLPVTMLTVLGVLLLVCSQIETFGFPIRLARDAGMPLLFLTAYGVGVAIKVTRKVLVLSLLSPVIILAVLIMIVTPIQRRLQRLNSFEPTMQYTPAQATMARKTNNQPTIYLDSLLVTLVNPNIKTRYSVSEPNASVVNSPGITYILINQDNPYFKQYEKIFEVAQLHFVGEATDPLHTVRLYSK